MDKNRIDRSCRWIEIGGRKFRGIKARWMMVLVDRNCMDGSDFLGGSCETLFSDTLAGKLRFTLCGVRACD